MNVKPVAACCIMAIMSGCAAPGVKPEDTNVFQAAGNLATGEFDKQLEREQLKLLAVEQELRQEKTNNAALSDTLERRKAEKDVLLQNLIVLRLKNDALGSEIQNISVHTAARVKAKNKQLAKLAEIRKQIDDLAAEADRTAFDSDRYRNEVEELNREIEVLREIALSQ